MSLEFHNNPIIYSSENPSFRYGEAKKSNKYSKKMLKPEAYIEVPSRKTNVVHFSDKRTLIDWIKRDQKSIRASILKGTLGITKIRSACLKTCFSFYV